MVSVFSAEPENNGGVTGDHSGTPRECYWM